MTAKALELNYTDYEQGKMATKSEEAKKSGKWGELKILIVCAKQRNDDHKKW